MAANIAERQDPQGSQTNLALNTLAEHQTRTGDLLSMLEERLEPVLTPDVPTPCSPDKDKPEGSHLRACLISRAAVAGSINERIARLMDRIDL